MSDGSTSNVEAVAVAPLPQEPKGPIAILMENMSLKGVDPASPTSSVTKEQVLAASPLQSDLPISPERVTEMVGEIKDILNSSSPSKIPIRKPSLTSTDLTLDLSPPTDEDDAMKKRRSMSPSQKEDMANRLYSKAMELKEKRDNLYRAPKEECTFKPTINRTPSKRDELDKDRFLALHEDAEEIARRREELKHSLESQYTYKPEISNLSRRMSARHDLATATESTTKLSRAEELYLKHQEIEAKREEKKKEQEEKTAVECTFKPQIKKLKGKSPPKAPLYDAELMKQKRLEKETKKVELELAECTFKPQTKTKKSGGKSFFDRLQESDKKKEERLEKLRKAKEEKLVQETTFRPAINENKKLSPKQAAKDKVPFHERLFNKEQLQTQAVEREQKRMELEAQVCTFKPEIKDGPAGLERRGSIFDRLYEEQKKKAEMLDLAEQEKLKKEMEECTFKPQVIVDPASILKELPQTPVWERLASDNKLVIEEREKLKEEMEQKECTFKPNIQVSHAETQRRMSLRRPSSPTLTRAASVRSDPTLVPPAVAEDDAVIAPTDVVVATDDAASKNILENYDNWAASLEEKMRGLK
ncbi:Aste57867_22491 [Aphanomyces stellatus]|uniref:Aste57867_22491 protein n=1 Tax=Aphanomyces stellatus TaxID=120398 RepID=A0A485LQ44_9STRA|nr:hypothetical protein As57867_022421 [Aphanomyces stellatus]VFT99151.1 Aste57867_22491 [Aphanomyces stellatus]